MPIVSSCTKLVAGQRTLGKTVFADPGLPGVNYRHDELGTGMANPAVPGKCGYCAVVVECIYL